MNTVDLKFDDLSNFHKAFPTEKVVFVFWKRNVGRKV